MLIEKISSYRDDASDQEVPAAAATGQQKEDNSSFVISQESSSRDTIPAGTVAHKRNLNNFAINLDLDLQADQHREEAKVAFEIIV